jgi:hypothetical protein
MKEEPVVTGPTTHTPKNCIIWTLSTLLFLTLCVFGANFFLTEKNENVNDAFSATDDDASIKNWEEWRNKGVHKITTDTDRADLIHSLDEHDEGISTLLHHHHQQQQQQPILYGGLCTLSSSSDATTYNFIPTTTTCPKKVAAHLQDKIRFS